MKMKFNLGSSKVLKASALVATLMVGQSCSVSVLDEEVVSNIGNNYLNTAAGFNDGVNAVYSGLRNWYGTERGHNFTIFGTDTYQNAADGSHKFINTYDGGFDARSAHVREVWNLFYETINAANAVIDRSANVTGVPEATKKQRIAEVKAIRAHQYFILTQMFGGVDLRLSETVAPTKEATRATIPQMYAAIIKDLEEAIPDLDPRYRHPDYGRLTKPAAQHLLGKVYLTKASTEAKAADDYAKAEALLKQVIDTPGAALVSNYGDIFRQGNETNSEVVFGVQYTNNLQANGGGNNSHLYFLMEYDVMPGMRRDVNNGRPWKRYMPTKYALNQVFVNRDVDSRYYHSFKDVYYTNNPGTYNTNYDKSKPRITLAQGDTAIFDPGFEMSAAERAKRPYQVITPSMYDERRFPALRKHIDLGRADLTTEAGVRDYQAFRLAETYLLLAEAQFKQGKIAEATENINKIRRRAAWPGKQAAMEITPAQLTMDFIMEESARELMGEQTRWFDLKRWGVLLERVKQYNDQAAPNIKEFHLVRPIPQDQIDRVEGGNASFPQNPGY